VEREGRRTCSQSQLADVKDLIEPNGGDQPMTKKILFKSLVVALTLGCLAMPFSTADGSSNKGEGAGYFMIGSNWLDMDELNSRLRDNGYTEFSDSYLSLGGGGHGIVRGRYLIGGEGHGMLGRTEQSTIGVVDYGTKFSAGYGFFDVGVVAIKSGGFNVYPLLGLGGGGVSLNITQTEIGSFDDILENPDRSSRLTTWGFLINLGLGIDYLAVLGDNEQGEGGIVIGMRTGYIFSPFDGDWNFEGETLPGGPDLGLTGAYLRLTIGGGGRAFD
jgi:hypothetical protein